MDSTDKHLHDDLLDWAMIGASHMAHGLTDFASWSNAILTEKDSESIRPFLPVIFDNSKKILERTENIFEAAEERRHKLATQRTENSRRDMSRVHELLTNEVLRAEHRAFVLRFLLTTAAYVGTTLWLNSIRQTAALWFVWVLIVVQLFFFLTIFVVCSLRLRQCGFRHRWLLFIPLFLSRVENWEIVVIPVLALCMIILSARNRNVAPENQNLLAAAFSEPSSDPSEQT